MAGYSGHNYMNPNPELRKYNGEYYMYTPTKTQDYDWGSVGIGGTVEKVDPFALGYRQNDLNNTYNAVIDPTTWANNGKYTPDEIKTNVQKTFSGFDPNNSTGWQGQLDTLTKQATDLYNQNPARQDKVFGDVWNTFRYNPANSSGIQTIQTANNNPRPEFTSQEQAGVYAQTGQVTNQEQRDQMARGTLQQTQTTNQPTTLNSGDFAVAYKQKFGTEPTSKEITDWVTAGRPSIDTITPDKAPSGGVSYTVKGGDTLSQIARKFNTSIESIMAANPSIKNPNLIYSNQTIQVPGINSNVDKQEFLNSIQNKIAEDLKKFTDNSSIFKTDEKSGSSSEDNSSDSSSNSVTDFKMPTSSSDLFNQTMNTPEIKEMKNKMIEFQKEIDTLDAEELAMEGDIRKQIEGEAPNSVIKAMVAEKVRALYPKRLAIQAEAKAVQSQLEQALENAKQEYTMKLQDRENGLKYLDTLIAGGTKLTAEEYKIADQSLGLGAGFAKSYFTAMTAKQEEKPIEVNGQLVQRQKDGSYKVVFGTPTPSGAAAQEYEYYKQNQIALAKPYLSFNEYQTQDANRKAVLAKLSNSGLDYKVVTQVDKLSSSFDLNQIVKDFSNVQNKKLSVEAIIDSGVGGPADLALVFEFMKALDPNSVVRDTEYATAAKSGNIFQGIYAKYNGYLKEGGGFLPDSVKQGFKTLINTKFEVANQQYQNYRNETARKINMKTGDTDGLDYLTDYGNASNITGDSSDEDPLGLSFDEPLSVGNNSAQQIASAIRQVESGGNYQAKGGSGEFGAYQFMPSTWKGWAKQYLGNENAPMSQANQDKVAVAKINDLIKQGYGAKEIALIWNGGQPIVKKGVNKYGVAYDSGAYANKVLKVLS